MAGKRKPPIRQRPIQVKFFVDEKHIARQLNATGNIYEADIEEIKKNQEKICEGIKKTLFLLSNSDVSSAGVQPVLKEPPKGLGCFPTSISKSQLR